jgi:benzoyl-CoA reductase/2-hydroxyglutaryl-CoA dehydratase subunit BcrC/BadD/HgdB
MYSKLLSLCGFSPEDLEREKPRIEKAFQKAGLKEEDFRRAEKRVETFFDIQLEGVRRLLGVWVKEFIHFILAGEERKKIIYSTLPSLGGNPIAVVNLISKDFYACFPDVVVMFFLSSIFGKANYLYETAETHALPAGFVHCGIDQLRLGRYLTGLGPKPDLQVSWAIFCDEAPKLDDMISEYFGVPTVFINRCQDGWEVVDGIARVPERNIAFAADEIKRSVDRISEVLNVTITDEMLMGSLLRLFELYDYWVEIGLLMKNDPLPARQADLMLLHFATVICFQEMDELIEACRILLAELKDRVNRDVGPLKKGSPRVFLAGVPPLCDPGLLKLIEELGLGINSTEYQVFGPSGGPRFDIGDAGDLAKLGPYQIIARIFSKNNLFAGHLPQIQSLKKAFRFWNVDGVLWHLHTSCRTYSTNALMLKESIAKDNPDLPFIIVEGDYYDPRAYNPEQLRVRLETFADMVKIRKARMQGV